MFDHKTIFRVFFDEENGTRKVYKVEEILRF